MRCFIAIGLPESLKDSVGRIQERLKKKDLFAGRFVKRENLHMTLKFLGEISSDNLLGIRERLRNVKIREFRVRLGRAGVFSERFMRIIWIEILGNEFIRLQREIDSALGELFGREKRFMGHLTIARVKNVLNREGLMEELEKIDFADADFCVDRFFLIESWAGESGVTYRILDRFFLS